MSQNPLLSIVTINRNHSAGLQKTIASLRKQDNLDFQWVLVDGGSTDDSMKVAQTFLRPGDVFVSESDRGIYHAMNKGAQLASAQYVLYLNSGDTLIPHNAIDTVLRSLVNPANAINSAHPKIDVLLFGFEVRGIVRMPKPLFFKWWSMPTSHQAIVYSRPLLLQHPYDESFRYASDFHQFLTISGQGIKIVSKPFLLVHNEPYGSDASLEKVLREYQKSLLLHGYPFWITKMVYFLKTWRLRFALR